MSRNAIVSVERLSKRYRLGQIGATTLRESTERLWHRLRGRDPAEQMGEVGRQSYHGDTEEKKSPRITRLHSGSYGGQARINTNNTGRESMMSRKAGSGVGVAAGSQARPGDSERGGLRSLPAAPTPVRPDGPDIMPSNLRSSAFICGSASSAPSAYSARDDLWALRDISFEVKRGEVLGIIGRNGAGKSTLLKILSRITEPTSGRAVLRGRVGSLLEVGTGFHPELSGRENIYLNGAIHGMKKAEITRKFDEIVAFSEVERFIDTPVKRYSSGMYVRLAFAVAAHLEPEILLVDEVLAVGDLGFQKKCLGKMQSVAGEGRTVLFVSHNMAAVQALCHRVILLADGQTVFDGSAGDTVTRYVASMQDLAGATNLADRTDREGGARFRFLGVEFCDGRSGVPVNTILSGQEVLVKVRYTCPSGERMSDVVLSVSFVSPEGSFLFACRSDAVGRTFTVGPDAGIAHCKIPRMPINQGRYTYNVIAYQKEIILDWVSDAGFIDVTAGDYYGTGKVPAASLHGVFVDYSWE